MKDDLIASQLTPFVLTVESNVEHLNLDLDLGNDLEILAIEDDSNAEFAHILNRGNQNAFGGPQDMGMPLWVMLDCGILPSAVAGYMLPRDVVSDEIVQKLSVPDDYDGYVPVSEYCACPTIRQGEVCGFSLHSHLVGRGIATRTKALGLCVYNASRQIGVTQFSNPAIRVHVRFGPLEVLIHRPAVHTHSEDSFVYGLDLPPISKMEDMARGDDEFGAGERPDGLKWIFEPDNELLHGRLHEHLEGGGRAWVIPPGWRATEGGHQISMVLEN
ncbi:MAG: hypothetical protein ACQEVA_10525 [Myxococcota bacterium]